MREKKLETGQSRTTFLVIEIYFLHNISSPDPVLCLTAAQMIPRQ